jgi:hypothetical protein
MNSTDYRAVTGFVRVVMSYHPAVSVVATCITKTETTQKKEQKDSLKRKVASYIKGSFHTKNFIIDGNLYYEYKSPDISVWYRNIQHNLAGIKTVML